MAPIKQKHIRGNQSPSMNKDIHKAIMTRARLRNRFLKEPIQKCYGSLNVNCIKDNKNFWMVVKSNF